jgi:DNA-directed RNA polymerase subunit H
MAVAEIVKEFKPSAHRDVPKHEIVPKEEVEGILKKNNATFEQLPYILTTDPVVLELQGKPGDLIKITRESRTAGSSVYYRLVVEG